MVIPYRYIIITPVRDEEKYIGKTMESVLSQTIRPAEWIIVNDGSSDNTGKIIDEHATQYTWIKAIHREDRGFRQAGGGVIEAFYDGYKCITSNDWEFIVKLDGDLSFDADYFERCFKEFDNRPELGIGGGEIYNLINGTLVPEKNPIFHVRGATKIYKGDCWDAIGKLLKAPGWDTLDEVKANMLGWETKSFPEITIVQHRYTGAQSGTWRNLHKNGRANYISGYHPIFMLFKCLKRTLEKPYLIGSIALFLGFISGYLKNIPQVNDNGLIDYLRKQQIRRLLLRESIWK